MAVQGLWNIGGINLPDFGISEALGIGPKNTAVTNPESNKLSVGNPQQVQTNKGPISVNSPYNVKDYQRQQGFQESPLVGGGATVGGGSVQGAQISQPAEDPNAAFLRELDNIYNARLGYLNQAEGQLRGEMPNIEKGIQGQYDTSRNTLASEKGLSEGEIARQEVAGGQRKEDAQAAARRLYNELITGGQQRFGGASSAGEAYQALSGRELQRNNQTIQQDFGNFMSQIEGARTSLNERFNQGLQQLELQKNTAIDNARREYQNKLLEINRLKAGAAEDKANRRLEALQTLRNQAFEINMAIAQMNNSLTQQKQQADSELENAISLFGQNAMNSQQAQSQFGAQTTTDPVTGLQIGDSGGMGGDQMTYTGRIRDEENPVTGAITPRRDLYSTAFT